MAKKLIALHSKRKKVFKRGALHVPKTLRKNMQYDGAIFDLRWKSVKVDRPKVFAICDVSGSVANYARFITHEADLARDARLPHTSLHRYWALLEAVYFVRTLLAWSGNPAARLARAPKALLLDPGLQCSLLDLDASRLLNDDLPCLYDTLAGRIVELPFTTSTADKTFIGYPYPMRGGPDGLADVWNSEFDVLHRESQTAPRFMILSIQTWATGRPAPLRTLRNFVQRVKSHNDTCIARCSELATWCTAAS